jgi:hypothetical protein
MNVKEHILTCIIEECAEVQQAATKALRFGLEDGYPGTDRTNGKDLTTEFIELHALIQYANSRFIIDMPNVETQSKMMDTKLMKLEHYMQYAKQEGTLHD